MSRNGRDGGAPSYSQQLLTAAKGEWSSLVVVPATPGLSGRIVADALTEVCGLVRGKKAKLIQAEGMEVDGMSRVIVDMTQQVADGGLAVVSVDAVAGTQSGVPVLLAADAALLVIHLGVTRIEDAKKSAEIIGESKLVGAVTLEPAKR